MLLLAFHRDGSRFHRAFFISGGARKRGYGPKVLRFPLGFLRFFPAGRRLPIPTYHVVVMQSMGMLNSVRVLCPWFTFRGVTGHVCRAHFSRAGKFSFHANRCSAYHVNVCRFVIRHDAFVLGVCEELFRFRLLVGCNHRLVGRGLGRHQA